MLRRKKPCKGWKTCNMIWPKRHMYVCFIRGSFLSYLAAFTCMDTIVEPWCDISTYFTKEHHASSLCSDKDRNSERMGSGCTRTHVLNIKDSLFICERRCWLCVMQELKRECALTGKCASVSTRPFTGDGMGVAVRVWTYSGVVVDFRELKYQFWGRWCSHTSLVLEGPDLGEGDLLWGRGLGVRRWRLGLIAARGASWAWTGTAIATSVEYHTPCKNTRVYTFHY